MTGQIIIVNGTSGAGKSTTCSTFARRADTPYLMFGMDLLVSTCFPAKYTLFGDKKDEGYNVTSYGPMARRAIEAMNGMIAGAAHAGQNMIVDHFMFLDPPFLQDCIWRLVDVPVLLVNLKPSHAVLAKRHSERTFELPAPIVEAAGGADAVKLINEALASTMPWFYERAYANDCVDLELDSGVLSADEVCERIQARLKEGPGTAFDKLRRKYPKQI